MVKRGIRVTVYYPTGGLALGEKEKIKKTMEKFIPVANKITGYRITLKKATKSLIKRSALSLLTSQAFLVGENEILFSPLCADKIKETLLHEFGHVEWFKRFGKPQLSKRLVAREWFGAGLERVKGCMMNRFILEIGADYLVFKWGQNIFRGLVEAGCKYFKGRLITAPEGIALLMGEIELIKLLKERGDITFKCEKVVDTFEKAIAKSCKAGYYIKGAAERGAVRMLIKIGTMVAVSIVDNNDTKSAVRKRLAAYKGLVEGEIADN
jgi:hypothetical protein